MREHLVSARLPDGRIESRGKIIRAISHLGFVLPHPVPCAIFYRDVSPSVLIRFCDAWPIDHAVADYCDRQQVVEVHYWCHAHETLYTATTATIRREGINRTMNGRAQWLLPLQRWDPYPAPLPYPIPRIPASSCVVVGADGYAV